MMVLNGNLPRNPALVCVGVFLLAGVWIGLDKPVAVVSRTLAALVPSDPAQIPRPVFRYSVIPGGAYSAEELSRSRRLDPVVAAHYVDFAASGVTVRAMEKDTWLYVSYRKGNRVYWTTHKHRIPKGEAVISDGRNMARARCGNRLSFTPHTPVFDVFPPTEQALNTPEAGPPFFAAPPELAPLLDGADLPFGGAQPIAAGPYTSGPTRSGATAETPLGPAPYFPQSIFPFASAPFFPGFGIAPPGGTGGTGSGGTGSGGTGGGGAGAPPIGGAAAPEPFSAGLMLIGVAALISLRRSRI